MDAEHAARMRDVFDWLDEAERRARDHLALVILMQANPDFEGCERRRVDGYAALKARLREIAARGSVGLAARSLAAGADRPRGLRRRAGALKGGDRDMAR